MTDEAIARSLGISSRTINRRMTLIMEAVGAHSRFQLGFRLTPELRAAVDAITDITTDADESASPDQGTTRSLRLADRLRRQLERRGRPVQAVMWLWVEGTSLPSTLAASDRAARRPGGQELEESRDSSLYGWRGSGRLRGRDRRVDNIRVGVANVQEQSERYTLVSLRDLRQLALSGTLMTPYRRLSRTLTTESERGRDRRPANAGRGQSVGLFFDLPLEFVAAFDEPA